MKYVLKENETLEDLRYYIFLGHNPSGYIVELFKDAGVLYNLSTMHSLRTYSSNKGEYCIVDGKRYYIFIKRVGN